MWTTYYQPRTIDETLALLQTHGADARIVAGGTDVLVELQRGVRPASVLVDITTLSDLKYVRVEDGIVRLGALATHNDVIAMPDCMRYGLPLAQACWEVGAPQIRNRATVAGNLVTASPANDTIAPLMALGAEVVLVGADGERTVPLDQFYLGVRRTVMQQGELVREIRFPALRDDQRGLFVKLGLRRAQAISVISLAFVVSLDGDTVTDARITLGCVAPTVVHATSAETFLVGKTLDAATCAEAGRLAAADIRPIDDLRGSATYRLLTVRSLVADSLRRIAESTHAEGFPTSPVLLATSRQSAVGSRQEGTGSPSVSQHPTPNTQLPYPLSPVVTTINGQRYDLPHATTKTLLDALREDAALTGTKEGCAEGECGACTVWLNGAAVMACLVPAAQANGCSVTTIEGLAATASPNTQHPTPNASSPSSVSQHPTPNTQYHPLQRSFVKHAAVQCGYCIPGMLMAGAKLLEERPQPDIEDVRVALSGNICRCTGYRKILDAVLDVAPTPDMGDNTSDPA